MPGSDLLLDASAATLLTAQPVATLPGGGVAVRVLNGPAAALGPVRERLLGGAGASGAGAGARAAMALAAGEGLPLVGPGGLRGGQRVLERRLLVNKVRAHVTVFYCNITLRECATLLHVGACGCVMHC